MEKQTEKKEIASEKEKILKKEGKATVKKPIQIASKISSGYRGICDFFQNNDWLLTVLFFLAVFLSSVWVWYGSILNVQPSRLVVDEFQTKQREIDSKIQSIERTIEKMQERRSRFNNLPQMENQRDIFQGDEQRVVDDTSKNATRVVQ